MSWDQSPPEKQELEASALSQSSGWDSAPPSQTEIEGEQKNSMLGSAVRGFNQGVTANFADEISAGVEAAGSVLGLKNLGVGDIADLKASDEGPTLNWDNIKKVYNDALNTERGVIKKDLKDNPGTSAIANIGGAIVSPINKITKGASLAKAGMMYGGVQGLGASEEDSLLGVTRDGVTGAAVGGVLGKGIAKAMPVVSNAARSLADKTGDAAEQFAAKAIGAERGTIKKLGYDKVKEAGRYALDNKIVSSNVDDMIAQNNTIKSKGGKMMGDVYSKIDDAGASTFKPLEVASKVDEAAGGFYRSPINKADTNQLENTLESILIRGEKNLPLREAQALKQEIGKVSNWNKASHLEVTDKEKIARDAYKIIAREIDEVAEKGAEIVGVKGLASKLKKGKDLFGKSKNAEMLLTNKQAREQGNRFIGLTDGIVGGSAIAYGGATGDWTTAIGIMAAKKGLGKYGASSSARTLDTLSKSLKMTPKLQLLFKNNPAALNTIVSRFEGAVPKTTRAAEKKQSNTSGKQIALKGKPKWEIDGFAKIVERDKSKVLEDPKVLDRLFSSAKGRKLLVSASSMKSEKSLKKILDQIKNIKD